MDYFKQKLTYTEEGELLDDHGNAIMMEWERPIMKEQAKTTTSKGGRVLNIGFGMGIIDSYIAETDGVIEHWIIEPHPDVQREMMKRGWLTKANCICNYATQIQSSGEPITVQAVMSRYGLNLCL